VWEDHLLPRLTCQEAARLGCTCKALHGVVRERFRDLRTVWPYQVQGALTAFPRAREMTLSDFHRGWGKADLEGRRWGSKKQKALLQWLREGGRGRYLATVGTWGDYSSILVHTALRGGALPSLKTLSANLEYEPPRALLTDGLLRAVHELRLRFECGEESEAQLAALGLVRQLPALATLKLDVNTIHDRVNPLQWPPFVPPSLKALTIDVAGGGLASECLLRALSGMLGASGARLERLEVVILPEYQDVGDGLVHVADALRCCSATLQEFRLGACGNYTIRIEFEPDDYEDLLERLHVHSADVLAGVSACRELQVLVLPHIEVEPLFPPMRSCWRACSCRVCGSSERAL
jgi:hypothetical protein